MLTGGGPVAIHPQRRAAAKSAPKAEAPAAAAAQPGDAQKRPRGGMAQNMAISFTCCTACATASRPLFQSGVSSATAAAAEAASASSDAYERTRLGTGSPEDEGSG